jgi:primosomal protein N' (replication factor Y)
MAEPSTKKLRLKRENSPLERSLGLPGSPVASILVDTGVTHLVEPYDYLVPLNLDSLVLAGSLVEVHFGSRVTQGYVLERREGETAGLKFLDKVISTLPLYAGEVRELIERTSQRYAATPWDVIRGVIPPRTISVEKRFVGDVAPARVPIPKEHSQPRTFHAHHVLRPGESYIHQILEKAKGLPVDSSVLIILPDYADLARASEIAEKFLGEEVLIFEEALTKSERYRLYLRAWQREARFVIGTRSAIFSPLPEGSTIIVYGENEPAMWDKRFPAWNVRDVALLRSARHNLLFLSHSPSLEILRLAHSGWLKTVPSERSLSPSLSSAPSWRPRFTYEGGGRSPELVISDAVKHGSVLITVARKGYINSFACSKCRNIAHCTCGARLRFDSAGKVACSLCALKQNLWKCEHCGGSQPRAITRGGERLAEELRLRFPNLPIVFSSADRRALTHSGPGIVIATNGAEPFGDYFAVLLMDGETIFSSVGLRDDEESKRAWFAAAAMVRSEGEIFISFPSENPVAQSLTRWSVEPIASAELAERNGAGLPPYFRVATISGVGPELESLKSTLSEVPLFSHVSLSSPSSTGLQNSTLHLRTPIENSSEFEEFFATFARVRSIKGLPHLAVRIDPYSF